MNNEEKKSMGAHNLILEERGSLTVTGVEDIDSFDDQTVVIYTGLGELTVRGNQLHIERIDLQAGELELQGQVDALTYADQPAAVSYTHLLGMERDGGMTAAVGDGKKNIVLVCVVNAAHVDDAVGGKLVVHQGHLIRGGNVVAVRGCLLYTSRCV